MGSIGKVARVSIIGCGEVSQVAHIPNLGFLSHKFQITYLCDVSDEALQHCKAKVLGPPPQTTREAEELCSSPDVDIVLIANSDHFHVPHVILGLKYNKIVFVEKPMALFGRDADLIVEAEKQSKGKVMVGYMRRYAAAFIDAVKEIGNLDQIHYARVREIIGPNSSFVGQSGTYPRVIKDFQSEDSEALATKTVK